jgi:hypothetical protein
MTEILNPGKNLEIPKEIARFVNQCPRLLPGETEMDYWALFDLLMEDMVPATNTEWLVLSDIVGLFWEIRRYVAWKGAILAVNRVAALESALQQTHFANVAPGTLDVRHIIARQEAEKWRTDPEQRRILDARLAAHGYDEVTLNAGALLEALVPIGAIERFLSSARAQLNGMLKEVYVRREFANRARQALDERLQAAAQPPKPQPIALN